jgi:Tol biopolymer transport system component
MRILRPVIATSNLCPAWSGDGRWIAWTHAPKRVPTNSGWPDRTARLDTSCRPQRLIRAPSCPVWSPDGGRLALAAVPAEEDDLERAPVEGGNPQRVLPIDGHVAI